jgi:hypothetical protein
MKEDEMELGKFIDYILTYGLVVGVSLALLEGFVFSGGLATSASSSASFLELTARAESCSTEALVASVVVGRGTLVTPSDSGASSA